MKTKSSRFDRLVAQYYPAVYSFAARFTDNPSEAVALTRDAFSSTRKQAQNLRNPTAIAIVLILAVIRAGLGPPNLNCISQTFALQLRAAAIACVLRIASRRIHTYCERGTNEALVHQRGTTA